MINNQYPKMSVKYPLAWSSSVNKHLAIISYRCIVCLNQCHIWLSVKIHIFSVSLGTHQLCPISIQNLRHHRQISQFSMFVFVSNILLKWQNVSQINLCNFLGMVVAYIYTIAISMLRCDSVYIIWYSSQ